MKLNRCDILALWNLTIGLLAACLSPSSSGQLLGLVAAGFGLMGCILSFLLPED